MPNIRERRVICARGNARSLLRRPLKDFENLHLKCILKIKGYTVVRQFEPYQSSSHNSVSPCACFNIIFYFLDPYLLFLFFWL